MAWKKLRFTVMQDEREREIFSIGELATGDLTIVFRGTDNVMLPDTTYKPNMKNPIKELRTSLHRSQKSINNGTFIAHTQIYADGTNYKTSTLIKNSKKRLLYPLYSALLPDLTPERYDLTLGRTAKRLCLATDIPKHSSLMMHIFACGTERYNDDVSFCNLEPVGFKNFTLLIYTTYVNRSRNFIAASCSTTTLPPRINGEETNQDIPFDEKFPGGAYSLPISQLSGTIEYLSEMLIGCVSDTDMRAHPELPSYLFNYPKLLTKTPLSLVV